MPDGSSASTALSVLAVTALLAWAVFMAAPADAQEELYDCPDFTYQEDAQAVYDQDTSDPYGLNGSRGEASDGIPGVACEELPRRADGGTGTGGTTVAGGTTSASKEVV